MGTGVAVQHIGKPNQNSASLSQIAQGLGCVRVLLSVLLDPNWLVKLNEYVGEPWYAVRLDFKGQQRFTVFLDPQSTTFYLSSCQSGDQVGVLLGENPKAG